ASTTRTQTPSQMAHLLYRKAHAIAVSGPVNNPIHDTLPGAFHPCPPPPRPNATIGAINPDCNPTAANSTVTTMPGPLRPEQPSDASCRTRDRPRMFLDPPSWELLPPNSADVRADFQRRVNKVLSPPIQITV